MRLLECSAKGMLRSFTGKVERFPIISAFYFSGLKAKSFDTELFGTVRAQSEVQQLGIKP